MFWFSLRGYHPFEIRLILVDCMLKRGLVINEFHDLSDGVYLN